MEQTPLLANSPHSTDHLISVRFCVFKEADCNCPCACSSCCRDYITDATQIVVPNTTTVGEFIHILNETNSPSKEYKAAFIKNFRLRNEDLLAPTIRSFEKFEAPIIIVPQESGCCCLLI